MAKAKNNTIALDPYAAPHMGMISPDGKVLVVSGSGNNTIYLIDMASMKITARIKAYGEPEHMDITDATHAGRGYVGGEVTEIGQSQVAQ